MDSACARVQLPILTRLGWAYVAAALFLVVVVPVLVASRFT